MPRIVQRRQAIVDLLEIHDFISDQADTDRADNFIRELEKRLVMLSEQPHLGRARDDLARGLRSHPVKNYLIFYTPLKDGIELIRVLYGGRDLPSIFED